MIYLAAPIDQANGNGQVAWMKSLAIGLCTEMKVPVYDPGRPFIMATSDPKSVVKINNSVVDGSEGVLALLPKGIPSVGVPMEIERAASQAKPVAVIGSDSMMLTSYPNIATFDPDHDSIEKAIRWLLLNRAFDDGMPRVYWKGDPACEPKRGYPGDAGFDLVVASDTRIALDGFKDVSMGISVQLPPGVWAMLTGRSSTLRKRGLLVTQGIIDNGYRGLLYAGCRNLSEAPVELKRGERIAQLIPYALQAPELGLQQASELTPTERGENGFGSTGV